MIKQRPVLDWLRKDWLVHQNKAAAARFAEANAFLMSAVVQAKFFKSFFLGKTKTFKMFNLHE